MDIAGVMKSNVNTNNAAAATGEPETTEMRMLTAAREVEKDRPVAPAEIEMAEIRT